MVRIDQIAVVVKRAAVEASYRGGVAQYEADAPGAFSADDALLVVQFAHADDAAAWADVVASRGVDGRDVAVVDPARGATNGAPWLEWHGHDVSLARARRFDVLSSSESGLRYVRERSGVTRVLTESELAEFDDPPPCPSCAEQFGCEHYNCAGEPLLTDGEIANVVPREWSAFAKDYGISRGDLERLRSIERAEGEYRLTPGARSDMRMLELVLLLNEAR